MEVDGHDYVLTLLKHGIILHLTIRDVANGHSFVFHAYGYLPINLRRIEIILLIRHLKLVHFVIADNVWRVQATRVRLPIVPL